MSDIDLTPLSGIAARLLPVPEKYVVTKETTTVMKTINSNSFFFMISSFMSKSK